MAPIIVNPLYFITMDEGPLDHLQQVEMACAAGIRWVQLRMKGAGETEFLKTARAIKKICDGYNCCLIINDRADVAREIGADGVHLGQEDMPVVEARRLLGNDLLIGGTANTVEDTRKHAVQGADYIGLGPYRYTTTKKKLSPVIGLEGYREIMKLLRQEGITLPVVAIGGITGEDLAGLLEAGVHGIAFSGLLVRAADKGALVKSMQAQLLGERVPREQAERF